VNKWEQLDTAEIPSGGELRLLRRGDEFSIRIVGTLGDLMNSRTHGSEDALGVMGCEPFGKAQSAKVLVGGLGMGFTLAATLETLPESATVVVAELIPGVVKWNQEVLGECAGNPLADKRVQVIVSDVRELIKRAAGEYDAILLDVDNGPEGLTQDENDDLYSLMGLEEAYHALRPSGILAVWSAGPSPQFNSLLQKAGFTVDERHVRAHNGKGARHVIWLAKRD